MARERNFHISIEQIGFESFYDDDLLKFNKRVDTKINMEVLELLRNVKGEYGEHVSIGSATASFFSIHGRLSKALPRI